MTTYGDKQEPGVITDVTSSATVATSGQAPSDVGIVGQADLANATSPADTSKVYQVTRASKAVELFGPESSSMLTNAVIDALNEGAFPVYAVATDSTQTTEDISGVSSAKVALNNAPIREGESDITVTLDSTDLTTKKVYDDVRNHSPQAGECFYNPVRGTIELPSVPGDSDTTNDTVDYEHFDYATGIDVMVNNVADVIDYLVPLSENSNVVDDANLTVGEMEQQYNLAIAVGGADIRLDPNNFTQEYDDSRTQVVYPTRFKDDTSALGAYAGFRAQLGLSATPINKRLSTNKELAVTLNRAERGSLIDKNVVPLANEVSGIRIADDPTTVSSSNTDEQNIQYGFNRSVADFIIETTRTNQQPFVGRLNTVTARNTLESIVNSNLQRLKDSNSVSSFSVNVFEVDATAAGVEMTVDLSDPLRFIENTVTLEDN